MFRYIPEDLYNNIDNKLKVEELFSRIQNEQDCITSEILEQRKVLLSEIKAVLKNLGEVRIYELIKDFEL